MSEFKDLYEFIDIAERNRKYAPNTAHGRRAALRIFEKELHPEEISSLELVANNLDDIYRNVVSRNKDAFSLSSLSTYKSRFLKVLDEYQRYGSDPDLLQSWQVRLRNTHRTPKDKVLDKVKDTPSSKVSNTTHSPVYNLEISLQNGGKFLLESPGVISPKEADTIKRLIDALSSRN